MILGFGKYSKEHYYSCGWERVSTTVTAVGTSVRSKAFLWAILSSVSAATKGHVHSLMKANMKNAQLANICE